MSTDIGTVEGMSASGAGWSSGRAGDIRNMFFNTLKSENVKRSVQISTFSLGNNNEEVAEFFSLIEELLKSERDVSIIVNDDQKGSCSKHAKITMRELKKRFPARFSYQLFDSKSETTLGKILHAKLVVVDRKTGKGRLEGSTRRCSPIFSKEISREPSFYVALWEWWVRLPGS